MLFKWARPWMLVLAGVMLHGLCPAALANTTVVEPVANDIGDGRIPLASVALLLPTRSGPLGSAADALRSGFLAAYERNKNGLAISVIEAPDTPADMLAAYLAASQKFDILIGPLSRTGITAIVQSGKITKPTIALTQPDLPSDHEAALPQLLLPIGLSIETEARQVADWMSAERGPGKVFVVATNVSWQKRVANAFAQQAANVGMQADVMLLSMAQGVANPGALDQLKQRIQTENPSALFVALTADQALQVRSAVGADTPMYGISQLNSVGKDDSNRLAGLDGVRLLDIPWLLMADKPSMMAYPRQASGATGASNPDLARLYALGIDAYNVTRQIAARNPAFQINGATGKLNVGFGVGTPAFDRAETTAVYENGVAVPLDGR
ncbi:penicillin-binding protein activator [Glaciimonas sp. PCH181]|uniref:penicillin-binding protein activator n=1 Tax=Glaciimonas sp. PCH181 TaxID=2133943 RepID=UPI000D34BD8D|nr:penicillin-binding protein activator [Glaciimonas sp. PCH181]PUA18123.1 glycosylase [Glaciimonas sp. PCH181]